MGNTYKREAVNFSIPKSTGFLTTGIENFKGLHITDNPFVADKGSASDILNLYVDETNKLVTRPRLDFAYDIKDVDGTPEAYIDVVKTSNATFFLGENKLFRRSDTGVVTEITPQEGYVISQKRIKWFEKDGVLYFFDGLKKGDKYHYSYVDQNELKVVENFYVPTTTIGRTSLVPGAPLESLNSLTNKYRETWRWDGTWGIVDDGSIHTSTGKGLFISQNFFNKSGEVFDASHPIVKMTSHGYATLSDRVFTCYDYDGNKIQEYDVRDKTSSIDLYEMADDFKLLSHVEYVRSSPEGTIRGWKIHIHYQDKYQTETTTQTASFKIDDNRLKISRDKSTILIISKLYEEVAPDEFLSRGTIGRKFIYDEDSYVASDFIFNTHTMDKITLNSNGDKMVVELHTSPLFSVSIINNIHSGTTNINTTTTLFERSYLTHTIHLDDNDNMIVQWSNGEKYVVKNVFDSNYVSAKLLGEPKLLANIGIKGDVVWGVDRNSNKIIYINVVFNTPTYSIFNLSSTIMSQYFINSITYYDKYEIYTKGTATGDRFIKFSMDINNPLQEVVYERTIDEKHPQYVRWNKLNSTNTICSMFTNFMNNYWLADGKILRASMNNNPLYLPISEYNEFSEDITGMNRLGDTLLAIYSTKNIYLQRPIYSEDGSYKMASTETKTTKGNVAHDAPTITSHSNLPVHIGKDGIYALRLEENVQSTERLAVLLSEKMNTKILQEPLQNCKTFNYKFYTYFIFPNEVSHVYLFDNRTFEWFYWELPIKILSIYEKDDMIYLSSEQGVIYRLETEDELDDEQKSNPITIYSDEVSSGKKQTIPWKWVSQIMYLSHLNNMKQLYTTSFILLDDDSKDNYGLNYKFKAFKKYAAVATEHLLASGEINYIKTVTRRTYLSAFNFLQLTLENPFDESVLDFDEHDSNKLSLVGIMFKYKLLPGGM